MAEENGHVDAAPSAKQRRMSTRSVDKDAQEMVIDSLRAQVQDLFSQVSQLNNKLVKSYDRVSDLEDDLHVAAANVRTSSLKISQLELERTQHLSALNTGLLVEKSHVTTELNRLMEKATEEAAQRGQAESARIAIEKDLDDLSATLFGQANSMVAEARFDKHLSERKVEEAENALKTAEEAVQVMQAQMQAMLAEREEAEKKTREMEQLMGKGKWVQRGDSGYVLPPLRLLGTHSPYSEYQAFIAHLRVLHPSTPAPPAMSTLLPLPFLARLLTEDTEPTVRLDLAPSLNWLSRRSVLTAIYSGQLTIEPVSAASLFTEAMNQPSSTVAGMNSTHDNISCALCGLSLFATSNATTTPMRPSLASLSQASWSAGSFFKKTNSTGSMNGIPSPVHGHAQSSRSSVGDNLNSQVFIFRLASLPSTSIASLPISSLPIPSLTKSSSQSNGAMPSNANSSTSYANGHSHSHSVSPSNQPSTIYPLCMTGWCLNRLRATCILWAFVRAGILDKVWEEELPPPPPPANIPVTNSDTQKPPVPPRKRGLWGIASALGERAASWSGDEAKEKAAKATTSAITTTSATNGSSNLPPAPPHHPPLNQVAPTPRRLPPPLPPASSVSKNTVLPPTPPAGTPAPPTGAPPPLPRRSEGRTRTATATPEPVPAPPPLPARARADHTNDVVAPPITDASVTTSEPTAEQAASAPAPASPPSRAPTPVPNHAAPAPAPTRAPISTSPRRSVELPSLPTRSPRRSSHIRTHSAASLTLGRPSTPANVPLPESRPGTPGIPSRATSPAIVLHAPGGAAPPPLPRRAAARTRVISVVDEGGSTLETTSASEAGADAQAAAPAATKHTAETSDPVAAEQEPASEHANAPVEDDAPKPADDAADPEAAGMVAPAVSELEAPAAASESLLKATSGDSESEKFLTPGDLIVDPMESTKAIESSSPVEAETKPEAEPSEQEEQNDTRTIVEPDHLTTPDAEVNPEATDLPSGHADKEIEMANEEVIHINGEHTEAQADALVVEDPTATVDSDTTAAATEQATLDTERFEKQREEDERRRQVREKEEKEEKYKVGYVGDASWEEKAWRGIIRLREDMFWARIGGFRD